MKYILVVNGREDKTFLREELNRQIEEIQEKNPEAHYDIETYYTKGEGDGSRYVRVYCDLHPAERVCFIACGGDGTINEVASGIVGFDHKGMSVLAYGTGNDFVTYYKGHDFKHLSSILKGTVTKVDILKINDNYSLNVCDFGFDSVVAAAANEYASEGKSKPFEKGILKAVFMGRYNRMNIFADGEKLGGRYLLLGAVANAQYVGNGYLCAPFANNEDGIMDVCIAKPMTLYRFVKTMKIFKEGKHMDQPRIAKHFIYRKAKHVEISSDDLIELCLDGELLPGTHFDIDILPKAIKLVLPAKYEVNENI